MPGGCIDTRPVIALPAGPVAGRPVITASVGKSGSVCGLVRCCAGELQKPLPTVRPPARGAGFDPLQLQRLLKSAPESRHPAAFDIAVSMSANEVVHFQSSRRELAKSRHWGWLLECSHWGNQIFKTGHWPGKSGMWSWSAHKQRMLTATNARSMEVQFHDLRYPSTYRCGLRRSAQSRCIQRCFTLNQRSHSVVQ